MIVIVKDIKGLPIEGVQVRALENGNPIYLNDNLVAGLTDSDGQYQIDNTINFTAVNVSMVGYTSATIPYNGVDAAIAVILQENEVMVTACNKYSEKDTNGVCRFKIKLWLKYNWPWVAAIAGLTAFSGFLFIHYKNKKTDK